MDVSFRSRSPAGPDAEPSHHRAHGRGHSHTAQRAMVQASARPWGATGVKPSTREYLKKWPTPIWRHRVGGNREAAVRRSRRRSSRDTSGPRREGLSGTAARIVFGGRVDLSPTCVRVVGSASAWLVGRRSASQPDEEGEGRGTGRETTTSHEKVGQRDRERGEGERTRGEWRSARLPTRTVVPAALVISGLTQTIGRRRGRPSSGVRVS